MNNFSDHKMRPNRKRGRVLCGKCGYESPDWADEFLRMYEREEKRNGKFFQKIKRPEQKFYRKKSDALPQI